MILSALKGFRGIGVSSGFALALVIGASLPRVAMAAPSLILLEDNGETNAVYRKVIEGLGAVIVANNLGRTYDHIDVLTGDRANRTALFEQIRKRGLKSDVDVVLLTHGMNQRLILSSGNITEADLRAAGLFPRLRMVYMMACYSASLLDAWRAAGARVAIGHQDINSMPGFFFPRLLRRWSEGASVHDAVEDAYRFSEGTAQMLSTFIKETELLSVVGVSRSEPVISGVDIDRSGHTYVDHSLKILPFRDLNKAAGSRARVYSHTDFERMGISLLSSMIPQATLNPDAIPTAQALVNGVGSVAWDQLRDSFPTATDGFSIEDLGLPTAEGEEIWLDGESLRFLLASVREYGGERLAAVLDRLQGVRLTRAAGMLNVGIYFSEAFTVALSDPASAPQFTPYEIHVPRTLRFSINMKDGVLQFFGLDSGHDALNLKLKLPVISDTVYLRKITANMTDGKIQLEAGVIGNFVTVLAGGEVSARKFTGVDIWGTISRNLSLLTLPTLFFH